MPSELDLSLVPPFSKKTGGSYGVAHSQRAMAQLAREERVSSSMI
jgi:hypothetical protein